MPISPHRAGYALAAALAVQPLLAGAAGAATAADLVGEWAPNLEACDEGRTVFEADGTSRALVREDGEWQTIGEGRYSVAGDTLSETITAVAEGMPAEIVGTTGETEIVEVGPDSLTLRPMDAERRELVGGTASLVRCPPRG